MVLLYDDGHNAFLGVMGRVPLDKGSNSVPLDDGRTGSPLDDGGNGLY